jgi:hypothetical protein
LSARLIALFNSKNGLRSIQRIRGRKSRRLTPTRSHCQRRPGPSRPPDGATFGKLPAENSGGVTCDFMEPVFFRQEVLVKYQADSGFDVRDDGSVSCHGEWGLTRSTWRLGNELLATAIGDFAQGVPFHEWPHWQQHAVEPASSETVAVLKQEQTVAGAVNSLVQALGGLNRAFARLASSLGMDIPGQLWSGSPESLAGSQPQMDLSNCCR